MIVEVIAARIKEGFIAFVLNIVSRSLETVHDGGSEHPSSPAS